MMTENAATRQPATPRKRASRRATPPEDVTPVEDIDAAAKRPAHRPSRRQEIIEAAIVAFARSGYSETSVEDVAAACGVAPTAIYYHFGGKEELFDQAMAACLDQASVAAEEGRGRAEHARMDLDDLRNVVAAGWDWWQTHPDMGRFMVLHQYGPTQTARRLRQDWEERHAQRAFDYLPEDQRLPRSARRARERHAAQLLATRTINGTIINSQAAAIDGALAGMSVPELGRAVEDVCVRVLSGEPSAPGPGIAEEA